MLVSGCFPSANSILVPGGKLSLLLGSSSLYGFSIKSFGDGFDPCGIH